MSEKYPHCDCVYNYQSIRYQKAIFRRHHYSYCFPLSRPTIVFFRRHESAPTNYRSVDIATGNRVSAHGRYSPQNWPQSRSLRHAFRSASPITSTCADCRRLCRRRLIGNRLPGVANCSWSCLESCSWYDSLPTPPRLGIIYMCVCVLGCPINIGACLMMVRSRRCRNGRQLL